MNRCRRDSVAILRMRVCTHMFPGLLCLIYLTLALRHPIDTWSILTAVQDQIQLPIPHLLKRTVLGKNYMRNSEFTLSLVQTFFISVSIAWLSILLLRSGDIQPHPGPSSVSSSDNSFNNLSSSLPALLDIYLLCIITFRVSNLNLIFWPANYLSLIFSPSLKPGLALPPLRLICIYPPLSHLNVKID